MESDGIIMADDVNNITLTAGLPTTRSTRGMPSDVSKTFECMAPEATKFELAHPSTLILTLLDPAVFLPIVNPPMVIQKGDDASIPPLEMLNIMKLEEKRLIDRDNDATLLES